MAEAKPGGGVPHQPGGHTAPAVLVIDVAVAARCTVNPGSAAHLIAPNAGQEVTLVQTYAEPGLVVWVYYDLA